MILTTTAYGYSLAIRNARVDAANTRETAYLQSVLADQHRQIAAIRARRQARTIKKLSSQIYMARLQALYGR